MHKILFLLSIPLIFSCSTSKSLVRKGNYTCTVYSYTRFSTELSEQERYVEKTMVYQNGRLIHEQEFSMSGDSASSKTYFYDANGRLDTIKWLRNEVNLPIIYKYDNGQITEVYDIYNGNIQMRERHERTDSSHKVLNYLGGHYSTTMHISYNEAGLKTKEEFYSPYGEYWGMNKYSYTDFGEVARFQMFNKENEPQEVTIYSYDRHRQLTWVVVEDRNGRLIDKVKYEYGK